MVLKGRGIRKAFALCGSVLTPIAASGCSLRYQPADEVRAYATSLVAGRDISNLIDPGCSAPNVDDLVAKWNDGVDSIRRSNDWTRFVLVDSTGAVLVGTLIVEVHKGGVCLPDSAFGRYLPESYPGQKCTGCTVMWKR
jgi:hypothetical protein